MHAREQTTDNIAKVEHYLPKNKFLVNTGY